MRDSSTTTATPCTACGQAGVGGRYHSYLDCLRQKYRAQALTPAEITSLFDYAQRGEAATFRDSKWVDDAVRQQNEDRGRRNAQAKAIERREHRHG